MRASAALVRGVALLDSETTCSIVDFPHEVSPDIEHLLRSTYLESLKLWPAAYGRIYRSSASKNRPSPYRHFVERTGLKALERLVAAPGHGPWLPRISTALASWDATENGTRRRLPPWS